LRDGNWIDVPCRPELFVVNIGDMMERWTGGRWASNFHRVANPPPGAQSRARQSIAYFLHPNHDALIAPVAGDAQEVATPIRAGDYMLEKERAIDGV
jgi:isopenicillin N synthase-like dioxygenase